LFGFPQHPLIANKHRQGNKFPLEKRLTLFLIYFASQTGIGGPDRILGCGAVGYHKEKRDRRRSQAVAPGANGVAVMNRAELQRLAKERISDAKVLLAARHWSAAYYLAGYAVECALKACIAKL
jgi:hypothetical protein